MIKKQKIRLGHSPDPDDAFMFYGLANGAVDPGPFEFEHILKDIQSLNDWARAGKLEVTAISVHTYPYVQDKYTILSSGASMGGTALVEYVGEGNNPFSGPEDGGKHPPTEVPPPTVGLSDVHGPLVVARDEMNLEELSQKKIGIPGEMTSAFLVLQLALGRFDYEVIMFDEILEAVQVGRVEAGLIIHEGQLTYKDFGLRCLLDLGKLWYETTALPLPLGCNVIRRDLGNEALNQISRILRESILYGLEQREKAVEYALQFGRGLETKQADEFVGMYVNEWTVDYGPVGREAVKELLKRGNEAGIVPAVKQLEFV